MGDLLCVDFKNRSKQYTKQALPTKVEPERPIDPFDPLSYWPDFSQPVYLTPDQDPA